MHICHEGFCPCFRGLGPFALDALTHKAKRLKAVAVPNPKQLEFQSLLATAHALADKAGAVILPHFRTGLRR